MGSAKATSRRARFRVIKCYRDFLLSSAPEILWMGSILVLYITVSSLAPVAANFVALMQIIWDIWEIKPASKEKQQAAIVLLESMTKIFDQAQVVTGTWWMSGSTLMALSKSRGRRPFDRDGERVVQVSMLRSDLMRTVDYLQHHFTAYDRNKVNVSINVNDCVSPLKLYVIMITSLKYAASLQR
eukprot:jgi/Bigna1/66510/fgenesh1_pg.1_\